MSIREIVLIGAGGNIEDFREGLAALDYTVAGYTDLEQSLATDLPYLGGDETVIDGDYNFIVTVGQSDANDNLRRHLSEKIPCDRIINYMCPSAFVSENANIAEHAGVAVMQKAVVKSGCHLDRGAFINSGAILGHHVFLGAWTYVSLGVAIGGYTTIGAGCFIGMGAMIFQNITIGENVTVGAGAIVSRNVPSGTTVYGFNETK